jgi:hypothetical protein
MTKIVINRRYGGFDLSAAAQVRLFQLGSPYVRGLSPEVLTEWHNDDAHFFYSWEIPRHDALLIQVVEELGLKQASGRCAELVIVEIPGNLYRIREYDGLESVETPETLDWIDASQAPKPVAQS